MEGGFSASADKIRLLGSQRGWRSSRLGRLVQIGKLHQFGGLSTCANELLSSQPPGIKDRYSPADPRMVEEPPGVPGAVILAGVAATSGAIVGFMLAGYILLAGAVFLSIVAGFMIGWFIRGLPWSDTERREPS